MNRYDLLVRGETIHIEFRRINDSRRLPAYGNAKNPNLFRIKGAVLCCVKVPKALCPEWAAKCSSPSFPFNGFAYCWHKDDWSARKGRHHSLAGALDYPGHDDIMNAEIVSAFTLAEQARTKVKGPARTPKTAKPKARRKSTFERIADALEKLMRMPDPSKEGYFIKGDWSPPPYPSGTVRPADSIGKE